VAGISSDYTPTASATSGLPAQITLDQASTGCSLTAGVVTFTGDGTCLIDAAGAEVSIGDMFGMQLLTSPTGALVELANGIVSADNQAIASMCRNCKG
jgi:hypothetical protein